MPTIIFGGGKIDITDRANRLLGKVDFSDLGGKIDITDRANRLLGKVDFSDLVNTFYKYTVNGYKVLASDSPIQYFTIQRIIPKACIIEISDYPLYGCLARANIVEVPGIVHRVNDIRHCPDLDYFDLAGLSTTNLSYTVVLQYDYNSVYTFNQIYIRYTTNQYCQLKVEYSTDGTTWTTLFTAGTNADSFYIAHNLSFRYLRFSIYSTSSGQTAILQIKKIILIR
jgi:hypothetical protein